MKTVAMNVRIAVTSLAGLALAALAGCGGGGGGGVSSTPAPIASLNPASVSFPLQMIAPAPASAAKTVTLKNTGNATLTLQASPITVTGTNAADFAFTTDCSGSLAASASCSINVTFSPTAVGSKSATLNVASDASGSPATLALSGTAGDNALAVTIDMGPLPTTNPTANIAYAKVTFCTPGTTNCRTVDHIQIDTGSYGLRVFKSALDAASGPVVTPTAAMDVGTSNPLFECVQYADGYTWGSVAMFDVQIGSRKLSSLRVQLTGASNYFGSIPSDCSTNSNGPLTSENQVSSFGANGILGIGNFGADCGPYCADPTKPQYGNYYQCPAASACTAVTVAIASQVTNPIYLMATDNNGTLIKMPSVSGSSATTLDGFVIFGINTQSDNAVGAAKWFALDPGYGTLTTQYGTSTLASSIVDSGSNAYFFDSTLTVCTNTYDKGFYCPTSSTAQSAVITGTNSATATINFTVDNTDVLFTTHGNDSVFPNLAGTNTGLPALSKSFDWGMPFFLGRPVFVLFEAKPGPSGSGVTGPALAF